MVTKVENKYLPLASFFTKVTHNEVTLTYTAIENIVGLPLPNAAYLNITWWKKSKPPSTHFSAWMNSGFTIKEIKLGSSVTFVKETDVVNVSSTNTEDILIIRPVELDDARIFIKLQDDVDLEFDFILFGKDEYKMSLQSIRKRIVEWKQSKSTSLFVGILNGEFAGFVALVAGPSPRASHRATIKIGVSRAYYGKSVRTSLLKKAEVWALKVGISRLELTVVEKREPTLAIYKKMGYVVEGTRSNSLLINEEYINELYMGKNI